MSWQPWCEFIFCFFLNTVSKRNTASNVLLRLSSAHVLTSRQILWVRVVEKLKQQTWCCCIWQVHHWEKVKCLSSFDSSATWLHQYHPSSPASACGQPGMQQGWAASSAAGTEVFLLTWTELQRSFRALWDTHHSKQLTGTWTSSVTCEHATVFITCPLCSSTKHQQLTSITSN